MDTGLRKVGAFREGKIFEWTLNTSDLRHWELKQSDYFTWNLLPNFKFYLTAYTIHREEERSRLYTIKVELCQIPISLLMDFNNYISRRKIFVSPMMYARFILLKDDSMYKCSGSLRMDSTEISVSFNDISNFDNLTILCIMSTNSQLGIREHFWEATSREYSLQRHMVMLLNNGILSDVTLCVDEVEFTVHRCILASRSSVFKAMFEHNTRELQENRIIIVDFTSDVIYEMLRYIYTGMIWDLSPHQYLSLLSAADKYELLDLKRKCSIALRNNMSSDLVVHVLIVADLLKDDSLKEAAIKSYLSDPITVMGCDEWILFMKHHTELANSLLMQLARKVVQ